MVTSVQGSNGTNLASQAAIASQQSLTSNYNTFLTLLTAQLQNQDPLEPTDSNQFVQQLVSFSGVEQQIKQSDQLAQLVKLQQGSATSTAVGYLGKSVTLDSATTALKDGAANWSYSLPINAASTRITIKDSSGQVVFAADGETDAGSHAFQWNGKSSAGDQLPAGAYSMSIQAKDAENAAVNAAISVKAKVQAVDLSSGSPMVETDAGAFLLEKVLRVDA